MANRTEIIRTAVSAYASGDLLPVDLEACTVDDMVNTAKKHEIGDTLLDFVILELYEGLETKEGETADSGRAVHLIRRAIDDLEGVANALAKLP